MVLPRGVAESHRAEIDGIGRDVSTRTADVHSHYLHYADPNFLADAIRDVATVS